MSLLDRQQAFGYTQEDVKLLLTPMLENAEEALGSMGDDAALPVLSNRAKVFYNYFKQLFAQVTNPPIDPIREELVMSLVSFVGPRPNLLGIDTTEPPMRLEVQQPILTADNMEKIRHVDLFSGGAFKSVELDICYPASWGANGMEAALASLAAHAEDAIRQGYNIVVLSDRSVSPGMLPIPALLATAAVHEHLVKEGMRTSTGPRRRDGLGPRGARLRAAGRLRRRGDPSVPGARDARAARAVDSRRSIPRNRASATSRRSARA